MLRVSSCLCALLLPLSTSEIKDGSGDAAELHTALPPLSYGPSMQAAAQTAPSPRAEGEEAETHAELCECHREVIPPWSEQVCGAPAASNSYGSTEHNAG